MFFSSPSDLGCFPLCSAACAHTPDRWIALEPLAFDENALLPLARRDPENTVRDVSKTERGLDIPLSSRTVIIHAMDAIPGRY